MLTARENKPAHRLGDESPVSAHASYGRILLAGDEVRACRDFTIRVGSGIERIRVEANRPSRSMHP